MGIADFLDTALSQVPGYQDAALWPARQALARSAVERAPIENENARLRGSTIQSFLDNIARERADQAAAPAATGDVLSAYQARPGSVTSEVTGPPPEGEQGDLGNQPSTTTATPGRGVARTVPELLERGVTPEQYRLAEQYSKPTMASLGLMTPEAAQQKDVEQQGRTRALGLQGQMDALDPSAPDYLAQMRGIIARAAGAAHPEAVLKDLRRGQAGGGDEQPQTMKVGDETWTLVPNLDTGVPTWHRAPAKPEKESAIEDWIASHPKDIIGLSPADARDKARAAIEARTVTTRVNVTQPGLSSDAVDRAADYVNQTGQLPAGLGFGNPRLRTQILDRAAQKAMEMGGDIGLAATQSSFKANQSEQARLQSQRGPVIAFMRTAEQHLARAEQLSQGVDRTEIPVLNRWLLSGQTNWTGNPQTATLAAVTKLATTEVAKVISSATGGGGVVSDSARKDVEDVLRPAMAKGQFSDVVQALRGLMTDRAGGYDAQIADTQARIRRLGGTPGAGAAPETGGRVRVRSKADPSRLGWIGAGEPIPADVEVVP